MKNILLLRPHLEDNHNIEKRLIYSFGNYKSSLNPWDSLFLNE